MSSANEQTTSSANTSDTRRVNRLIKRLAYRAAKPFRWLLRSSTLRLTLMLSVLFAIGMAVSIFLALTFGRETVLERVDTALTSLASTVSVNETLDQNLIAIVRPLDDLGNLPNPFKRTVRKGGGSVYLGDDFNQFDAWRVQITEDKDGTPILVALPIEDSEDALNLLSGILWTTAALVLAIALLIGVTAGLLAQRRLLRINGALGRLANGELTARTGVETSSDDLDDLARQLDVTASELERLVTQTRHLSASIAHDLRTPLARLRAQLEMLPEGEERGAALEEAGRLSVIFDTIMRVARIEAAQGEDGFERIELSEFIADIEDIFGPVVEDTGKSLVLKDLKSGAVTADKQMLIQAVANLIQNAIVHGGDEITLFAQANGNIQEIGVFDNGKGVPEEHFDEIIKPMVRLDSARQTDGSGLGLALVRAVADRHRAELELSQNKPQGLRAVLKFTK
ncbi:MAG: HAMP domain-containing histidine kinase [Rhizobiaceae bacterium]|nr:HAMP domain-containing histidine kinase [Rhizobiaceae bacterium]